MKKIRVVCPICNTQKRIPVPKEIFDLDESSLLKLPFNKKKICNHHFVALIDYNFKVRDYEIPDSQEIMEIQTKIEKKNRKIENFTYF